MAAVIDGKFIERIDEHHSEALYVQHSTEELMHISIKILHSWRISIVRAYSRARHSRQVT